MTPKRSSERPVDKTDAEVLRGLDELRRQIQESAEAARDGRRPGGDLLRHFPLAGLDDARSLLLDLVRDGACVLSIEGNVIQCNRAFAHMLGSSQDEVAGATVFEMVKPADGDVLRRLMGSEPEIDRAELTFLRADGRERRVEAIVQPTTLYGFRAFCLLARDLTEQRRLTDIVKGDELARIIFEQAAEAVVVCDADGKILRANRRAGALAVATPHLIPIDKAFRFLAPGSAAPREVFPYLQKGTLESIEADVQKDGNPRVNLLLNAGRINNGRGEFLGWVVTLTDITTRAAAERESRAWAAREKELNDSLQRHAAELTQKNEELEQFAFLASHDLQEPLRKIISFGELLAEPAAAMNEQGRDYLTRIRHAAHRMSLLIDDLLQYARATPRGEDLENVDLAAAVRDILSHLDVLIDQNGVKVEVGPLPTVRAVRSLMHPLFANLIGNAVKYRCADGPVIRIGARRDGDRWEIWVADNGIGIDPQHSDRIFRIFERLHTRKQYLGTGIGLAICKRIVEQHGGRIWVESAPGQGSTFRFTLPA